MPCQQAGQINKSGIGPKSAVRSGMMQKRESIILDIPRKGIGSNDSKQTEL